MAKGLWGTPDKDSDPFRQPSKKADKAPVEFRKPTYDKKSLFGKEEHYEGRNAKKGGR